MKVILIKSAAEAVLMARVSAVGGTPLRRPEGGRDESAIGQVSGSPYEGPKRASTMHRKTRRSPGAELFRTGMASLLAGLAFVEPLWQQYLKHGINFCSKNAKTIVT